MPSPNLGSQAPLRARILDILRPYDEVSIFSIAYVLRVNEQDVCDLMPALVREGLVTIHLHKMESTNYHPFFSLQGAKEVAHV